jgi:hypothetical protein
MINVSSVLLIACISSPLLTVEARAYGKGSRYFVRALFRDVSNLVLECPGCCDMHDYRRCSSEYVAWTRGARPDKLYLKRWEIGGMVCEFQDAPGGDSDFSWSCTRIRYHCPYCYCWNYRSFNTAHIILAIWEKLLGLKLPQQNASAGKSHSHARSATSV